jgi:hypothetical protein
MRSKDNSTHETLLFDLFKVAFWAVEMAENALAGPGNTFKHRFLELF